MESAWSKPCCIYHIVAHKKNRSTFVVTLPFGLTVFACHLFATCHDNAALNPALLRPLCGAILAAAFHILFRYLGFDRHSSGIDAENE
ncbi:hypothetical protein BGX26_005591 [Mortierella sp. AD094]|nr:hypothetical protein BGX26_005591 [Mortierella sp. AD094]